MEPIRGQFGAAMRNEKRTGNVALGKILPVFQAMVNCFIVCGV